MIKRIKITENQVGYYGSEWESLPEEAEPVTLCGSGMVDYFVLPSEILTVTLCASDRYVEDAYKVRRGVDEYSDLVRVDDEYEIELHNDFYEWLPAETSYVWIEL